MVTAAGDERSNAAKRCQALVPDVASLHLAAHRYDDGTCATRAFFTFESNSSTVVQPDQSRPIRQTRATDNR